MVTIPASWAEFALCPDCAEVDLPKGYLAAQGVRRPHCAVCRKPLDKVRTLLWAFADGVEAPDSATYVLRQLI